MVFGLSTSHEIGLAVAGAIFVTFSLLSSFVFPRMDPNFPGRKGLRWYLPLCGLLFIGMIASVLYFGREQKPAEAAAPPGTTTSPTGTTPSASPAEIAAGKVVFNSSGCSACHVFTPAGSTGKVGPNLDMIKDYASKAGQPLDEFLTDAVQHPPAKYVPPGFPTNAMPPEGGHTLTSTQLANLVAFLESGA
jgi:mono/diheme cytochrome c family protein